MLSGKKKLPLELVTRAAMRALAVQTSTATPSSSTPPLAVTTPLIWADAPSARRLADDRVQPDGAVDRGGEHEQAVGGGPGQAAAGARQDLRGAEPVLHRVDDGREMQQHQRRQHHRAEALGDEQPQRGAPVHSSPFKAAANSARFSPAMAAVGFSAVGQ